ncbi:TolC family protein [Bdellovibrio bacteriovorus]|uniref:TolC family protein n=1 Tax=Bdellovibrio bacteriovorus TaxID=959 RepID=UPI0035A59EED
MTKSSLWILWIAALSSPAAKADDLSLASALQTTLANNREIRASASAVEAAKTTYDSAIGKYLPSIGLTAAYTHLNEDITVDLSELRTAMIGSATTAATVAAGPAAGTATNNALQNALPKFELPVQKQDFTVATINLTQPLFTGGKITANKTAKEQLYKNSQSEEKDTQGRVMVSLVQQYFTVQLASEVQKVRIEALTTLQEHQRIAEALLRQGQLSKAQKMKVDVAVADAENALSKAGRDERLARRVLANTLDREDTNFSLTTRMGIPALKDLNTYSKTAQNENHSLQQIRHKRELLGAKKKAAKSEFMPTIALIGSYEVYEKDLAEIVPQWYAGIILRMNLFNGMSDNNELKTISQEKAALDLFEGHAQSMVNIGVEKYYSEILNAREEYQTVQKTKDLARESLRLNTAAFKNGFAKSTDVIDSQLQMTAVQLNELKALYDYNNNYVQLLKFSGHKDDIAEAYKK